MLIKITIESYEVTQSIKKRPKSKRTPGVVKARIARNPRRKLTMMATDFNMGSTIMRDLTQDDLEIDPHKLKRQRHLSRKIEAKRLQRSHAILQKLRTGNVSNIVSCDCKIFTMEQTFNPQNDRIIAKKGELGDHRVQKQGRVMDWGPSMRQGCPPWCLYWQSEDQHQGVHQCHSGGSLVPCAQQHFYN
ncbi:uncharacterized protein [Lepeophtheirus salmonis]|uniref:uncharacterized protein n=1 Tax=Lepeophtheirus salmonis TaxID=72036 RepID=UPI001AE54966|nr:uncharacterized protein LOC121128852 [Lepeophtheirus salmonis]